MAEMTLAGLGVGAEDLWDLVSPSHMVVAAGYASFEAVLVLAGEKESLFFIPSGLLPEGEPRIYVEVEGGASEAVSSLEGGYMRLQNDSFTEPDEAPGDTIPFTSFGVLPSLGSVAAQVPLGMLPEELAQAISELPFHGAEEPEELFADAPIAWGGPCTLLGEEPVLRMMPPGGRGGNRALILVRGNHARHVP